MDYKKLQNNYYATPKDNPNDRIGIIIGDDKQPDFKPQKKITRWDNEVNVSLRLVHDEVEPTFYKDGNKVIWQGQKVAANFYDLPISEEHPEGASEFEILLLEKPVTNVVEYTLVDKGVDYFYQPEISDEEAQRVLDNQKSYVRPESVSEEKWNAMLLSLPKTVLEMKRRMRPENVVGSYAIYAKEEKINITGGKEYKTGKVGHLYRPKIEDSNGAWTWGDLNIDKGILSVTIPQDFLDSAVYPVRHATGLTFGYTSIGASNYSGTASIGCKFTGGAGTLEKITPYWNSSSGWNIQCAIYTDSTKTRLETTTTSASSPTPSWIDCGGLSATISAVDYWLVLFQDFPAGDHGDYYDSGSTNQGSTTSDTISGGIPNTYSPGLNNNKYSIYATYTAGGGNITTTKTQTGKAKITTTTTKTQTGKARIRVNNLKTQTGLSRIRVNNLKTQTATSRIQKNNLKTQTGLAKIIVTVTTNKSLDGKSRINKSSSQNQDCISNLVVTTQKNQTGLSNIVVSSSTSKDILGKARLQKSSSVNQTGLSRLQKNAITNQSGKSRITKSNQVSQTGTSRITVKNLKTQSGKAKLLVTINTNKDLAGKARLTVNNNKSIDGLARISVIGTTTESIDGKARITIEENKNQYGVANILVTSTTDKTIDGKANIIVSSEKTIDGKANILKNNEKSISGKARILSSSPSTNRWKYWDGFNWIV